MENSTSGSYIYVNERKNWTDAQRYCRQHYTDLASARSQTENEKIREVAPGHTIFWIGLFRRPWSSWSGGSNSSFRFWIHGQPDNKYSDELCAMSELRPMYSGRWTDKDCSVRGHFICHEFNISGLCGRPE
uniref:C-type lectin domain-containing protein n=1 Tax=Myripristis murdjan TaxID=586833 RepID=A0A667ZX87_9TELE